MSPRVKKIVQIDLEQNSNSFVASSHENWDNGMGQSKVRQEAFVDPY